MIENKRHIAGIAVIEPLESRIAPAFMVSSTSPQNGASISSAPSYIDVIFSDVIDVATLQASDFRVDGVAATGFSMLGASSVRFNLSTPIIPGVHDMSIAAGSILDSIASPIDTFVGYFTIDTTAPRVVGSSISPNDTLSGNSISYQVRFDEAMSTAALDSSDFTLRGINLNVFYTPLNFSFDGAGDTLSINFINLPVDNYTLTLLSGNSRFEDRAGNDLDGEISSYPLPPHASGNGVAGGNTVIPFSLEGPDLAFPVLQEIAPLGSLAFQSSLSTTISAGDTDNFTVDLVEGQAIRIIATPALTLNPTLALLGPGGSLLANIDGASAGNKLVLGSIIAPATGTYTITLGSVGGTIGNSTVQVLVNSGLEGENFGGQNNNSIGNAQSLEGGFISIGGNVEVQTIQGVIDVSLGVLPNETEPNNFPYEANVATYNFAAYNGNLYQLGLQGNISSNGDLDFYNIGTMQAGDVITITQSASSTARGTLSDSYVTLYRGSAASPVIMTQDDDSGPGLDSLIYRYTISTTDTYYIQSRAYSSGTGTYQMAAFLENSGATPNTGAIIFSETETNNTAATANDVSSAWRAVQYLSHTTGATQGGSNDHFRYEFTVGDLVSVYVNSTSAFDTDVTFLDSSGATIGYDEGSSGPGLDSRIYGFRIPSTGAYYVKVSGVGTFDGYAADVYLSTTTTPPIAVGRDFYFFEIAAGETASVVLKLAAGGSAEVQIQNAEGLTLATGVTSHTNSNSAIHNFTAPSPGTYYVKVSGSSGLIYNLVALLNADFDSEANDSIANAQNLGSSTMALGHLGVAPVSRDFYTFNVTEAGRLLIISTDTFGDALTSGEVPFNPALELYDSTGTLVADDDDGAGDGLNALIQYTVPAPGIYTVAVVGYNSGGHYLLSTANDAPVLGTGQAAVSVSEDDPDGETILVSDLIATAGNGFITDYDPGAQSGLAIVGSDSSITWEFSIDGGNNWTPMGTTTPASARLLATDAVLRFIPAPDFQGTVTNALSFVAWDRSSGANGTVASTLVNGGTTAFSVATAHAEAVVTPINDLPAFIKGDDLTMDVDDPVTVNGWATGITAGNGYEAAQLLTFEVTNDNNSLFVIQPTVSANGTLSFTPAASANGTAMVSVTLHDNGGTLSGGVDTSATQTFTIQILPINDQPTFVVGANQAVNEDAGAFTISSWATAISAGPLDEAAQLLTFEVTNDNNGLFDVQPSVGVDGTLTYTLAAQAYGMAMVSVILRDDGGTLNGGTDASLAQAFSIQINPVNDAPAFVVGADQTPDEDAGAITIPGWATGLSTGPSDESAQLLTFEVTNDNNAMFAFQPAVSASGTLSYTLASNAVGTATVSVILHDDGGTQDGGVDTSPAQTFSIQINPVNDQPSFVIGANQIPDEDAGMITIPAWATALSAGPADESAQLLTFDVTNDNNGIFAVQPAVSANGTLSYTLATNAVGTATVSVTLHDDGGTLDGGDDTSAPQTFIIQINPANDAPAFMLGADITLNEDSAPVSLPAWVTAITSGPADESSQSVVFTVTNDNNALFVTQPSISPDGTLTYTLVPNVNGSATVSVTLQDDGGTANGGVDTSAPHSFTINVTPVNDAPVNNVPGAQQTREITPLVFSTGNGNSITISDLDVGGSTVEITLSAADGTLSLGGVAGLVFTIGDGTADSSMVFRGTTTDINVALENLIFLPADDFNGMTALQIITDDLGNTGGGTLTDTDAVSIFVTPIIHFTKKATYIDADGDLVTVILSGGGSGEIWLPALGSANAEAIILQDTTAKSSLKISTKRGHETTIGDIIVNGDMKKITARTTDLTGLLEVTGRLTSLRLDDVIGGQISIRTDMSSLLDVRSKVSIFMDQVADTAITTNDLKIKTLRTTEWLDTAGDDIISAPSIGRLLATGRTGAVIAGDFHASLDLAGNEQLTKTLGSASIKGNLGTDADNPVSWDITGQVGGVKVRGEVQGWDITIRDGNGVTGDLASLRLNAATALDLKTDGNIRAVTARILEDSNILAGIAGGVNGLPIDGDFIADAIIGRLTIIGALEPDGNFMNTNVAASQIGKLTLKGIQTVNGSTPFGVSAHSIARVIVKADETQKFSRLTEMGTVMSVDDFAVQIV